LSITEKIIIGILVYATITIASLVYCHYKHPKNKKLALIFSLIIPPFGQFYYNSKFNIIYFILLIALSRVYPIILENNPGISIISIPLSSLFIMSLRLKFFDLKAIDKKNKKKDKTMTEVLYFKTPIEALEFACEFSDNRPLPGRFLPAIVSEIHPHPFGSINLKIPTSKGLKEIPALLGHSSPKVKVGDMVSFLVEEKNDPPIGSVIGLLKPELDIEKGWAIES